MALRPALLFPMSVFCIALGTANRITGTCMTDWRSRQMRCQEPVLEATDKDYLLVEFNGFGKSSFRSCFDLYEIGRHLAKRRHTIMLLRRCEARSYAAYGSGKHRRHIRRLHVVLWAGLCAAILTKHWRCEIACNCSAAPCVPC